MLNILCLDNIYRGAVWAVRERRVSLTGGWGCLPHPDQFKLGNPSVWMPWFSSAGQTRALFQPWDFWGEWQIYTWSWGSYLKSHLPPCCHLCPQTEHSVSWERMKCHLLPSWDSDKKSPRSSLPAATGHWKLLIPTNPSLSCWEFLPGASAHAGGWTRNCSSHVSSQI